jgi:pyochelin biosynthetic protein PchC
MQARFLHSLATAGPGRPLVIFPPAGRGALAYTAMLPVAASAYAVVLPGRERRYDEPPARRIAEVVDPICDEVREVSRGVAVTLVGHSLGAYVAHAVAQRFEEQLGSMVAALGVAGAEAPLRQPQYARHLLGDYEFADAIAAFGGTPLELFEDAQLRNVFLPLLRADFELAETYAPRPSRLRCPIVGFAGRQDDDVDIRGVRAWERLTSGAFSLHEFDGGHFFPDDHLAEILAQTVTASAP